MRRCFKVPHRHRTKAEKALAHIRRIKPLYRGKVYYCAICHAYHFGRQRGKSRYRRRTGQEPKE